ncbi:helix-turn-helix domain-containing protein [Hathewaya histolytica]|uniref:Site-specific recombinase XerD n=1 Tax=Hathewaya histolytica TaxID=1498 RepID=A0A4U9R5S6_HATHI|nr:helix-turn-helix domain-containing protein [Hathewaya histolytica]VTQ86794.1 site-specific recombinase XerD [Hathewaya histolytica]
MTNYTITSNLDITNLKLSDGAYRCYNLLLSMCYGDKNTCYPSIKYIANSLGKSCRTINRYLKELVKLGYISKRRRGSISNIYTLLQKKVNEVVQKVKDTVKGSKTGYKAKKTSFTDYKQRDYDFNKLEELLLHGKGNYQDCLKE